MNREPRQRATAAIQEEDDGGWTWGLWRWRAMVGH